jgi:hypothetical protein
MPTREALAEADLRVLRDESFGKLKGYLMDQARERFKVDHLVDFLQRKGRAETAQDVVKEISKIMLEARYRFPKHSPIDAAYLWVRDGEV